MESWHGTMALCDRRRHRQGWAAKLTSRVLSSAFGDSWRLHAANGPAPTLQHRLRPRAPSMWGIRKPPERERESDERSYPPEYTTTSAAASATIRPQYSAYTRAEHPTNSTALDPAHFDCFLPRCRLDLRFVSWSTVPCPDQLTLIRLDWPLSASPCAAQCPPPVAGVWLYQKKRL